MMSDLYIQKDSRLCFLSDCAVLVTCSPARVFQLRRSASERLAATVNDGNSIRVRPEGLTEGLGKSLIRAGLAGRNQTSSTLTVPEVRDSGLYRMFLELTPACNLRCRHCYVSSEPSLPRERVDTVTWLNVVDQAASLGACQVDLTGGEPLLHPGFWTIVQHIRKRSMICTLFTNGTMLNESGVRRLQESGCIRAVCVSIDSHLASIHDHFRGKANAFNLTIAAIRHLREAGLHVLVNVSVHEGNAGSLGEVERFLQELHVSYRMAPPLSVGRASDATWEGQRRRFLSHLRNHPGKIALMLNNDDSPVERVPEGPSCGVGTSMLFADSDGHFGLCPTLSAREDTRFNLGSVRAARLSDAWRQARNLGGMISCRSIKNCPKARVCRGGCRSRAFLENKELDSPDHLCCEGLGVVAPHEDPVRPTQGRVEKDPNARNEGHSGCHCSVQPVPDGI